MSAPVPRCGTCNALFDSVDGARKHYESEYHLHNIRLRVEGKRPLTAQEYKHVRINASNGIRTGVTFSDNNNDDDDDQPSFACKLCKKTFHSVQTLQAHVRSTAHLIKKEQRILARDSDAASALTSTSLGSAAMGLHRRHNAKRIKIPTQKLNNENVEKVQMEEREEDVSEMRCLFCGVQSDSIEENLKHMSTIHEFTIPLKEKCCDVPGLLAYMARKVNGLLCLVCGEKTKSFTSLEALRAHMREKNHERIILDPEYEEFYSVSLKQADLGKRIGPSTVELVLPDKKRTVQRREAEVPKPRRKESEAQIEKRKAILAADQEALAVAKKERQEAMRVQNKEASKVLRRQDAHYQGYQLKVSLRTNKLHPKGYDGEGQVN